MVLATVRLGEDRGVAGGRHHDLLKLELVGAALAAEVPRVRRDLPKPHASLDPTLNGTASIGNHRGFLLRR